MFKFLKSLFVDPTREWKKVVHDPVLGELQLNEDATWWESVVGLSEQAITFQIGGEGEPDAALLAHAYDIIGRFGEFQRVVADFLNEEASRSRYWADEIRQLEIESVSLFWSKRPNDGMISFCGPDEYRLWRCDYVDRKPTGLAFDD